MHPNKKEYKDSDETSKDVKKLGNTLATSSHLIRISTDIRSKKAKVLRRGRSLANGGHLIPDAMITTLSYTQGVSMSNTGSPATQIFRGNSVYDPDYSGAGSQPNGFDEYAAFYAHYRVHHVKVTAIAVSANATASTPQMLVVAPTNTTSTYTSYADVVGTPYSKYIMVPNSYQGYQGKLEWEISVKKFFGISEATFRSEPYSATVTSNPSEQFYIPFYLQDVLSGAGSNAAYVMFKVDYTVEFYERKDLGLS
jgi:hypothetical protein